MRYSKRHKHHITLKLFRTPASPHLLPIEISEEIAAWLQHPLRKAKTSTVTPASRHTGTARHRIVTQQRTCIFSRYTVTGACHSAPLHRVSPSTSLHDPTAVLPESVVSAHLLRNTANS